MLYFIVKLTKAAEDKLLLILPEKERNRILKLNRQATPNEIHEAECEVDKWLEEIAAIDGKLKREIAHVDKSDNRPVRGSVSEPIKVTKSTVNNSKTIAKPTNETSDKKKAQRLSGYDFRAWEKFDVDAACAAVEQEEFSSNTNSNDQSAAKDRASAQQLASDISNKRKELFAKEMTDLLTKLEAGNLSDMQKELMAGNNINSSIL